MGSFNELAKDMEVSPTGLLQVAGRLQLTGVAPPGITGAGTALSASETNYWILGRMPVAGVLEDAVIRSDEKGVGASTTIDIFKVPSGSVIASVASGTILVTQVAANGLTDATDEVLTVSSANKAVAKGSLIVMRIVTQGSEVLEPVAYDLRFRV